MTDDATLAHILDMQERHLRLTERFVSREIDELRFRTELTRLRRETERLRQRLDESQQSTTAA